MSRQTPITVHAHEHSSLAPGLSGLRAGPQPTSRRLRAAAVGSAVAVAVLLARPFFSSARAQGQNEQNVPAEFTAMMTNIGDINELRFLNPLKLTGDQLDRVIAVVKTARDTYNRQLDDLAVPPIRAMAAEVKDVRRKMLVPGATVPRDFDAHVKKVQDDYAKQRDQIEADTLKHLVDDLRGILTKDQVAIAVQQTRKALGGDKADAQGAAGADEDKYFNYYVLADFVVYPHTLAVLEDMKKQLASGDSGALVESGSSARIARAVAYGSRAEHAP